MSHVLMRPDNAVSVEVSCFAPDEFYAANEGNFGGRGWRVDVACSGSVPACLGLPLSGTQPTRSLHEFSPVFGH